MFWQIALTAIAVLIAVIFIAGVITAVILAVESFIIFILGG